MEIRTPTRSQLMEQSQVQTPLESSHSLNHAEMPSAEVEVQPGTTNYAEVDRTITLRKQEGKITGLFTIRNITSNLQPIIFKVKSLHPKDFHVRPAIGEIGPSTTAPIFVELSRRSYVNSVTKSRFLVQIIPKPNENNHENIEQEADQENTIIDLASLNRDFKDLETANRPEKHEITVLFDLEDEPQNPQLQENQQQNIENTERNPYAPNDSLNFTSCIDEIYESQKWLIILSLISIILIIFLCVLLWYQTPNEYLSSGNEDSKPNPNFGKNSEKMESPGKESDNKMPLTNTNEESVSNVKPEDNEIKYIWFGDLV